jgi:hypothetical protein
MLLINICFNPSATKVASEIEAAKERLFFHSTKKIKKKIKKITHGLLEPAFSIDY